MKTKSKYTNAKNIKAELDAYVMGQEQGTRAISMAIAQHLMQSHNKCSDDLLQTDNVLLIGPTGCGKTETFRTLQKLEKEFCCPVCMYNILDYSATKSWQGDAVSSIFKDVFNRAIDLYFDLTNNYDETPEKQKENIVAMANRAIILLDEIDKIAIGGEGKSRQFLKEYQSNLLKVVEGNTYSVGNYTIPTIDGEEKDSGEVILNSESMMFIFLGAFSGIEEITKERLRREQHAKQPNTQPEHTYYQETCIGFLAESRKDIPESEAEEYTYEQLIPSQEDIIQYGFMRELVGRIPVRTVYKPLSEEALVNIMLNCRTSAYRKYQARFRQAGHELRCDRSALREIAHTAVERGTGARGLMNVFSDLLQDTQFELSGDSRVMHCLLRGKEIREHKPPLLHDCTQKTLQQAQRSQHHLLNTLRSLKQAVSPNKK